jgi:hypothetical protein
MPLVTSAFYRRAETEPQLAAAEVPRLVGEFVALTDAVQLLSQEPQSESAVKSFRATADTLAVAMWLGQSFLEAHDGIILDEDALRQIVDLLVPVLVLFFQGQ